MPQRELIEFIGITDDEYNYWKQAFEANVVQSLDSVYNEYSILFATSDANPEIKLQNKIKNQIREALNILNQREQWWLNFIT